jgi:ATP-dependent RNA helicase DDX56/DBP9
LADQVTSVLESFASFCSKEIQIVKLSERVPDAVSKSLLSNSPDIVVATPARAWHNIKNSALSVESLTHFVLDEADLVLSYGYSDDLQNIADAIPRGIQTILMSEWREYL